MSDPLLITVAPTGAETAKEDCPQLPTTPEEIATTARACQAAGAAMIHLHVRDAEHRPTLDAGLLREWGAAARDSSELIVQLSTVAACTIPSTNGSRCSTPSPTRAA